MTTLHNSNTHNAINLNRLTPNVTPVMLLLGWEEYRQHWLHTGVLLGEVGDRGHWAQPRVEKWRETEHIRMLTTQHRILDAVTRRSNNEQ